MLGLVQESGPYIMLNGEDTFHWNDYSWNREANMLYIDAPAGVGYSYCIDQTECGNFDDNISAEDNLNSLLYFFEYKFPERKKNDLYISGESYGGIYVPYLVNQIDTFNTKWADNPKVFKPNLKGFMVGNGVTNW
jgi:serine carboxypeptidase-like clade 2